MIHRAALQFHRLILHAPNFRPLLNYQLIDVRKGLVQPRDIVLVPSRPVLVGQVFQFLFQILGSLLFHQFEFDELDGIPGEAFPGFIFEETIGGQVFLEDLVLLAVRGRGHSRAEVEGRGRDGLGGRRKHCRRGVRVLHLLGKFQGLNLWLLGHQRRRVRPKVRLVDCLLERVELGNMFVPALYKSAGPLTPN